MTIAITDRWDAPFAPVVRRPEIEAAEAAYFECIARLGISREAYKIAARECVKAAKDFFAGMSIPSRTSGEETGHARWSTILNSFLRLLDDFGRRGWALCWGSIRTLARTFGTNARAAWERMRMLRDAGLVQAWERWRNQPSEEGANDWHTYEEGRSNVYLLTVPIELFAWWAPQPRAQALLASLQGPAAGPPAASPELGGHRSTPPAPPGRRAERKPATPPPAAGVSPEFLPALFHEVRNKDERYQGAEGKGDGKGGTMNAESAVACELVLRDEVGAIVATCEQHGWERPDTATLLRTVGRMVVRAWLQERGRDNILVDRSHAFGLLAKDFARLAADARSRWIERQREREDVRAEAAGRDGPRFLFGRTEPEEPAAHEDLEEQDLEDAAEARLAVAEFRASLGLPPTAAAGSGVPDKPPPD